EKARVGSDASFGGSELAIQQNRFPLFAPRLLVDVREILQISRSSIRVIDPFPKQTTAVDQIDSETLSFIFIGEIAPEFVTGIKRAQRLACESNQAPRPKLVVIIARIINMHLNAGAQLARVFVKCRLEPALA